LASSGPESAWQGFTSSGGVGHACGGVGHEGGSVGHACGGVGHTEPQCLCANLISSVGGTI